MPWKEKTVEETRTDFVIATMSSDLSFSALCRQYGISRRTGYKWLERYENGEKLSDRSRRPFKTPNKISDALEDLILCERSKHPAQGPRKLKRMLENQGYRDLPCASTFAAVLKRNGHIEPEESRAHTPYKRFEREHPNELWQADFKGDFEMLDRCRCYPLTVLDDHSRFSLAIDAKMNQQAHGVFASFERIFSEHGLPRSILTDNGPPWGNSRGYTPFELWLMQLDVLPIHGRPMHPQTQGKEERFHRTLKDELLRRTPIVDIVNAQERFDQWRFEYNYERPHAALGYDVPSKRYRPSNRPLTLPKEPQYDETSRLRKVNFKGYISIDQHRYYLSETFTGKYLEIRDGEGEGIIRLCYGSFQIAQIDLRERLIVSRRIVRL